MQRRQFVVRTLQAAAALCLPRAGAAVPDVAETFSWSGGGMRFQFQVAAGRLRQMRTLPDTARASMIGGPVSAGVETAIQCDGENSPDAGMKLGLGMPGERLRFEAKKALSDAQGSSLTLTHMDAATGLKVESHYQAHAGTPMVRRWTRVTNSGAKPVGVEYLSSAMLHGLAAPGRYDLDLRIHLAYNSWMAEGQWHSFKPSELGLVENERTSWSEASAGSVGSWSAGKYLPMVVVENVADGLCWFWQIEHNGSWYWEISDNASRGNHADDVYAYLGGPDDLHAEAWKALQPGASYETVPAALGCAAGGFSAAVSQLTQYRRAMRQHVANREPVDCPVIFNDYMNCLWGDPTAAKELPLIDAAGKAGCEYFVIDAGWYADLDEDWSQTIGAWEPSPARWPGGLKLVLDHIRQAGMIPGLWLEPEVAGRKSALARKDDSWFFMRHGQRVVRNSRLLLDFRNPAVTSYLDAVIARLVGEYGIGYIKTDYNVNTLQGTETGADSAGQGLLEHNRAVQVWLDTTLTRYPHLVIENCGSGGGRMDYAMLSRLQIQSMTDQEDYRRLPGILVGVTAAVLPEQIAVWSYPLENADADQASFNMATAMMCRIHQSGRLDKVDAAVLQQVREGIRVYKHSIRQHVAHAIPEYPLGMPDVNRSDQPVALIMRAPEKTFLAVWRLRGAGTVSVPTANLQFRLLYPSETGISITSLPGRVDVVFPRENMACILTADTLAGA